MAWRTRHSPGSVTNPGRTVARDRADLFCEAAAVPRCVQSHVVDSPAVLDQLFGEMRIAEEGKLLLVVLDVGCLFHDLDQEDEIALGVGAAHALRSTTGHQDQHRLRIAWSTRTEIFGCFYGIRITLALWLLETA